MDKDHIEMALNLRREKNDEEPRTNVEEKITQIISVMNGLHAPALKWPRLPYHDHVANEM